MERMTARVLRAPFTGRAARELLFCALGLVFGLAFFVIPPAFIALSFAVGGSVRGGGPAPAAIPAVLVVDLLVLAAVVLAAPLVGRWLGAVHRFFAAWLLGERIAPPATPWRLRGSLADGPGWRAAAYSLIKVPLGILEGYGPFCWVAGIVAISYPLWWGLFRNNPPGVTLSPVPVITPLGTFQVSTFAGTFAALAAGVAMLLAAPWLARGASTLDRAVMRRLLGPGRVQQLLATRTRAVDDAAARMRRLERDLHDGAQIRLATVAMNLGMATEKLGPTGTPPDLDQARDLVATAHRGAKEALTDLRNLIRGIHPPVLDRGPQRVGVPDRGDDLVPAVGQQPHQTLPHHDGVLRDRDPHTSRPQGEFDGDPGRSTGRAGHVDATVHCAHSIGQAGQPRPGGEEHRATDPVVADLQADRLAALT